MLHRMHAAECVIEEALSIARRSYGSYFAFDDDFTRWPDADHGALQIRIRIFMPIWLIKFTKFSFCVL